MGKVVKRTSGVGFLRSRCRALREQQSSNHESSTSSCPKIGTNERARSLSLKVEFEAELPQILPSVSTLRGMRTGGYPSRAHVPPTHSAEMLLVHDCFFRDCCGARPAQASGRIRLPVDALDECLILDWLTLELNLTLHLAARMNVEWTVMTEQARQP